MPSPAPHLVQAARSHDHAAWNELLRDHQLPLFTYAAELIRDRSAALDVVQETFARAVKHLASLRDDARFTSWIFGIAHQLCLQHLRRSARTQARFVDVEAPLDEFPDDDADDPRQLLLNQEQFAALAVVLEQLPDAQRAALLLYVIEDFSIEDIAQISGVPAGTVKSRLHHARRTLKRLLESHETHP